jgi:hypothetical protein
MATEMPNNSATVWKSGKLYRLVRAMAPRSSRPPTVW